MEEELKTEIKESKVEDLEKEAVNYSSSFLVGAVILSLLLLLGLYGWTLASKNTSKKLDSKIQDVDNQLTSLKDLDEQITAFSSAVSNIQSAISQKQKWSIFFKELNSITPKDVAYSDISIDEKGKVVISGITNTFSSLAKLLVALKNGKGFQNISLSSTSSAENKLKFSINLNFNTSVLKEVKKGE